MCKFSANEKEEPALRNLSKSSKEEKLTKINADNPHGYNNILLKIGASEIYIKNQTRPFLTPSISQESPFLVPKFDIFPKNYCNCNS